MYYSFIVTTSYSFGVFIIIILLEPSLLVFVSISACVCVWIVVHALLSEYNNMTGSGKRDEFVHIINLCN